MLFHTAFSLHVFVFSCLLFCSCVIGFLSCFSLRPKYLPRSLNPLFLTLGEFQIWDWLFYPLTCGLRGGAGVLLKQQYQSKFLAGRGLNLGSLTWQSSTHPLDHRAPRMSGCMNVHNLLQKMSKTVSIEGSV